MRLFLIFLSFFFLCSFSCHSQEQHLFWNEADRMDAMPGSLVETDSGAILAACYGGTGEGMCNVDMQETAIWLSRYEHGAWLQPQCIYAQAHAKCWNPVLVNVDTQHLALFFRIGATPRQAVAYLMHSSDDGKSWSKPEPLPKGVFGPTKNRPFTQGSLWICPSSRQTQDTTCCLLDVTEDAGSSWKQYGPLMLEGAPFSIVEPALFQDTDGHLKMMCRNRANKIGEKGYVCMSTFSIASRSFSPAIETTLPNPDSGIDCIKLNNGTTLLAHNDSFTERTPLVISISNDDGATWNRKIVLEDGPGEFSRPSLLQSKDGRIHIIYAYNPAHTMRKNIKHVSFYFPK